MPIKIDVMNPELLARTHTKELRKTDESSALNP